MKRNLPAKKNTALQVIELDDPGRISQKFFMVIQFPKSPSQYFSIVMKFANKIDYLKSGYLKSRLFYLAGFSKDKDDLVVARMILYYAHSWRGTRVYVRGQEIKRIWDLFSVLDCYMTALQCNDHRAHCCVVVKDPSETYEDYNAEKKLDKYLLPCRHLNRYRLIQKGHPSKLVDQLQAAAVGHGCAWCPFFDANQFRKVEN